MRDSFRCMGMGMAHAKSVECACFNLKFQAFSIVLFNTTYALIFEAIRTKSVKLNRVLSVYKESYGKKLNHRRVSDKNVIEISYRMSPL